MPAIPASETHIVPAAAAKTFPHTWVRDLSARAYGMDAQASLYLELVPYNEATGEIDHARPREVRLPLWEVMQQVPDAAAAMHAIFAAVPAIEAYLAAKLAAEEQARQAALNPPAEEPLPEN